MDFANRIPSFFFTPSRLTKGGEDEVEEGVEVEGDERNPARARGWRRQPMAVPPLARLQKLLLRLSDNWSSYRHFCEQAGVPATNNATERVIGRWRTRSRSVRGFKPWSGLVNAFILCTAPLI